MAASLAQRLDSVHPQMVAMRGEGLRKKVASEAARKHLGASIASALRYAGHTPKSASTDMGYADDTSVNRWINGAEGETPNMAKLMELPGFEEGWIVALARSSDSQCVRVRTTIDVEQRVSA